MAAGRADAGNRRHDLLSRNARLGLGGDFRRFVANREFLQSCFLHAMPRNRSVKDWKAARSQRSDRNSASFRPSQPLRATFMATEQTGWTSAASTSTATACMIESTERTSREIPFLRTRMPSISCQRAAHDAHALAGLQDRMRLDPEPLAEADLNRRQVAFGQRRRLSAKSHQPNQARNLNDFHAVEQRDLHKDVTGKERQIEPHLPIFPLAHTRVERQVMRNRPLTELARHALFMVGKRVSGEPLRREFVALHRGDAVASRLGVVRMIPCCSS